MRVHLAFLLLLPCGSLFFRESMRLAEQDLLLRPVYLGAYEGKPLPDDEALLRLEKAAALDATRADALLRLGERLERAAFAAPDGNHACPRAAQRYREAALAFPAWGLGQFRLATTLLREGDEAGARRHIALASRCAGNHPALLEHLGDFHLEIWRRAGAPEYLLDALDYFRMAAERDASRLEGILGKVEKVLPDPSDLRTVTPRDDESLALLATHLLRNGKGKVGIEVLETLPRLPEGARGLELRRLWGRTLLRAGRLDEGLDVFRDLFRAAEDPGAQLAGIEFELGVLPPSRRIAFLGELASLGPGARLAQARALVAAGDHAAAMDLLDKILADFSGSNSPPRAVQDRDVLVACYELRVADWIRRREPLQAAADASEAARLDPSAERWRRAGQLWAEAGNTREAKAAFERALREAGKDARLAAGIEKQMMDALAVASKRGGAR